MVYEMVKLQDKFGLSYGQLATWTEKTYGVKVTPMGVRKAILREFPKGPPNVA